MIVIKNFISQEDVDIVYEYAKSLNYHTKDNHVPLHDNLFNNANITFDIHTRGEMPKHILDIFSKYSKGMYEEVSKLEQVPYHPPMFSKHYIARYRPGAKQDNHYDTYKGERGAYGSYIYWNNDFTGGAIKFQDVESSFVPAPGDLVFFKESPDSYREIQEVLSGQLFLSEAWAGPVGISIFDSVEYDRVNWEDWEIKGF